MRQFINLPAITYLNQKLKTVYPELIIKNTYRILSKKMIFFVTLSQDKTNNTGILFIKTGQPEKPESSNEKIAEKSSLKKKDTRLRV